MKRLTRLLSRSKPVKEPPLHNAVTISHDVLKLLDLPVEILLTISSELQYENAVALSLTCQELYDLLFRVYKPTNQHHGREAALLRLLERDKPELLSCPVHEQLYDWTKQKNKRYNCPRCIRAKRNSLQASLVVCNKGCRQSFYGIFEQERRLMLRYSILGPEYGISIRYLNHVCKKNYSKRANEVRPKVVNGSLLLWRTYHHTFLVDLPLPDSPDSTYFNEPICLHHERTMTLLRSAAIRHAKQSKAELHTFGYVDACPFQPASWICPLLFKCDQCATDLRLQMELTVSNEVIVRFDAYQDLGTLLDLTTAQKQVLGAKHDWRTQHLSSQEKLQRLMDDIEVKFHETRSLMSTPTISQTTFLTEWPYISRSDTEQSITFRPDPLLNSARQPRPEWTSIPFHRL